MPAHERCEDQNVFRYRGLRWVGVCFVLVLAAVATGAEGAAGGATGIQFAFLSATINADAQLDLKCEVINRTGTDYSLVEYRERTTDATTESQKLHAPDGTVNVTRTTTTIDRTWVWRGEIVTRVGNLRTQMGVDVRFVREGPKRLQAQSVCPLELRISGISAITPALLSQVTQMQITCEELPAVNGADTPSCRNLAVTLTGDQLRQLLKP